MRGRKPVPTAIHRLRGTFNPTRHGRRGAGEPLPASDLSVEPPSYLSQLERECWRDLCQLAVPGVLTVADRPLVEIAARLWAEMRSPDPRAGTIGHARLGRLMACLASMGMTPADRSRVAAARPPPEDDEWAELKLITGDRSESG
jgi:phage terminase small subunit